MRLLKKTTRVYKVLKFISENEPVKTKDILKSLFKAKPMHKLDWTHPETGALESTTIYKSYPSWSGIRAHLTFNNGYNSYPAAIELTKDGYVLTEFGRKRLNEVI